MDEFAMGASGENSAYGITRNPEAPDRIPGGSSSGSAAAVASATAVAALGSDTGAAHGPTFRPDPAGIISGARFLAAIATRAPDEWDAVRP